jgi:electron-transferring-flavoprotein dehydrogenase
MSERETLDVDVLIVGAGPAGLSAAYHFMDLVGAHNKNIEEGKIQGRKLEELTVAVVEKGSEVGAHQLSGAVLDPISLREMIPDFLEKGCPVASEVKSDEVLWLSAQGAMKLPYVPAPMRQHGNYIISLSNFVKWLAPLVEEKGVMIMPGFAGSEVLFEAEGGVEKVVGVRMVDRGVNKRGEPKSNYQPGEDIKAKVTLFCDGTYGNLTLKLMDRLALDEGKNKQTFATGVKEIWEIKAENHVQGHVSHTMGWPLKNDAFGGGFVYHMNDNLVSVGLVVGLDYRDPLLDIHAEFQRFKTHPTIRRLLEGGKLQSYGAKTIPEGGWYAMPYLAADGAMILGDAAGMVNVPRLKGIHYAIEAGIIAAETLLQAFVSEDYSKKGTLHRYHDKVMESIIGRDLYANRYFKEYFGGGFIPGVIKSGISFFTGGGFPFGSGKLEADWKDMKKLDDYYRNGSDRPAKPAFDKELTFNKLDDIYVSGTTHEEDQPCHLVVKDLDLCRSRCTEEYGNPCQHFCPASVYNWITDETSGKGSLLINAPNCVHCKTCDIKDPYRNILWTVPEGGGGPNYVNL